ncbi:MULTISPECIES: hypothetical protein [Streptomyces]|uniref:Uncharacterized protein n=1 Tax=Streptomyces gougerotii TaxID=53448 RepID=A0A8H9HIX3_9ACTN|nr:MULTISPECIES: hypothetical protein [Streptomyces]MDQ0296451.1 hypothetical protein [Streptomyces sp. DSM 41037]RPK87109.1 hypothetical protein EES47_18620 [Streptomyces sp. ADI98-12]GFH78882.1 hypothetical protein Sgou_35520 [Streptomyces gougerotii]GGU68782.1 hypothetical protein GCM10010227_23330 [Streptomyces gougerotii]
MSHGVLALGGAALCLSGSVWYVPAWADLRAGPDRPASRRLAAAAVLVLWAGALLATALLAWSGPRPALASAALAGPVAAGTALAARARAGRERREAAAGWRLLGAPAPGPDPRRARRVLLAWLVAGLGAAVAAGAAARGAGAWQAASAAGAVAVAALLTGGARAGLLVRRAAPGQARDQSPYRW